MRQSFLDVPPHPELRHLLHSSFYDADNLFNISQQDQKVGPWVRQDSDRKRDELPLSLDQIFL